MFDPIQKQNSMRKAVEKLIGELKKSQIEFIPQQGDLRNVGFKKGDKLILMSHHSFYRYSGIAVKVFIREKEPEPEIVPVTDEMYLMNYIKPIVEVLIEKAQ